MHRIKYNTPRHKIHPGITPLAARFRLAARATAAKIRLWRIKHRRVQTAAVVLCRGVYVFVGWVEPVLWSKMYLIIHADTVFSCSRVYPREIFPCTRAVALICASAGLSARFLSLYPRGGSFPRFRGFIRAFSFPVPARQLFSTLPRVYSRVFFPCTRATTLFHVSAGIFARFLSLYPRGSSFPRFRGFIRAISFPIPARQLFSTLPRVYSREIFPCTRAVALFRVSAGLFAGILPLYPRGNSFPRFRGFSFPTLHARHYPPHNPELPSRAL